MEDVYIEGEEGLGVGAAAAAGAVAAGEEAMPVWVGNFCAICLRPWTCGDVDEHRICCIPCGHLYGRSCLLAYLQDAENPTCRTCDAPFGGADIIPIYTHDSEFEGCCQIQNVKLSMLKKIADQTKNYRDEADAAQKETVKNLKAELYQQEEAFEARISAEVDAMTADLRSKIEKKLRSEIEAELRAGIEAELRAGIEAELRAGIEEKLRHDLIEKKEMIASILGSLSFLQ